MCKASEASECKACGAEWGECECQDCPECGRATLEGDMDGDSGLCLDCHAACHFTCDACGDEQHTDSRTSNGLCETCEAERVDGLRDTVTAAMGDDARCQAIHAALKAAGLI